MRWLNKVNIRDRNRLFFSFILIAKLCIRISHKTKKKLTINSLAPRIHIFICRILTKPLIIYAIAHIFYIYTLLIPIISSRLSRGYYMGITVVFETWVFVILNKSKHLDTLCISLSVSRITYWVSEIKRESRKKTERELKTADRDFIFNATKILSKEKCEKWSHSHPIGSHF